MAARPCWFDSSLGHKKQLNKRMVRNLQRKGKATMLLALLICFGTSVFAQEVTVGDHFNNLGSLRNPAKEWKTDAFPLKLVLMYNNGKTTINGNAMNFLIEPDPSVGLPSDDQKLVIGQGRSWAAMKYDFAQPGRYTITAYDREKNAMASTSITIDGPKKIVVEEKKPEPIKEVVEEKKPEVTPKHVEPAKQIEPIVAKVEPAKIIEHIPEIEAIETKVELTKEEEETLMYETFYIAFGRGMRSGMLEGQNEKFKLTPGGHYVEVLFSNNLGFNTETIAVDVWMKPKGGSDYTEHVTDKNIKIPKGTLQSNFHLSLFKRGDYKVSLYTDKFVWIGSGYVSLY